MHLSKLNREEAMLAAFRFFDTDGTGAISRANLAEALEKIGEHDIDIDSFLRSMDANGDGQVGEEGQRQGDDTRRGGGRRPASEWALLIFHSNVILRASPRRSHMCVLLASSDLSELL